MVGKVGGFERGWGWGWGWIGRVVGWMVGRVVGWGSQFKD